MIGVAEQFKASTIYHLGPKSRQSQNIKASNPRSKSTNPEVRPLPFIQWTATMRPTSVASFELGKWRHKKIRQPYKLEKYHDLKSNLIYLLFDVKEAAKILKIRGLSESVTEAQKDESEEESELPSGLSKFGVNVKEISFSNLMLLVL